MLNSGIADIPMVPAPDPDRRRRLLLAAMVAVVTAAVFLPSLRGGFVNYDDDTNFLDNPHYRGLGPDNLAWMFSNTSLGLFMPLTWITLGIDYVVWGMNPLGYHLTNVLFHTVNAVLCLLLIEALLRRARPDDDPRARLWAAAAGALFFAVHPLRVESVAWITERRDVTSGLFILLTLLAYLKMSAEAPGDPRRRRARNLALAAFAGAMLCKPTGMGLPLALLVLDVYPLKRFPSEKPVALLREKIPFFVLMIAAALMTSVSLGSAKALYAASAYPFVERIAAPGYRVAFYVCKTLVPLHLSPLYMYRPGIGSLHAAGWLAMAAITWVVLRNRRRVPGAAAAWIAFGLLIAPVSGLFQAGLHFAADRYTYLPCLPFAALFAALLLLPAPRVGVPVRVAGAAGVLLLFAALSGVQIRIWRDSVALWDHALWLDPDSYLPYNNRGAAKADLGDDEGALADYQTSITIRSDWPKPWNNRGMLMATRGNHLTAVADFTRSLELAPDQVNPYGYRALSRIKTGDLAGARSDLDVYLRQKPEAGYFLKRANLRGIAGDLDGVIADCGEALRLQPGLTEAWTSRGMARLQKGDAAGGRADIEQAIRVAPPNWSQRARFEALLRGQ